MHSEINGLWVCAFVFQDWGHSLTSGVNGTATAWIGGSLSFLGTGTRNSSGMELPASFLQRRSNGKGWKWASGRGEKVELVLCDSFSAWLDHQREISWSFSLLCTYKNPLLAQYEKYIISWCFSLSKMRFVGIQIKQECVLHYCSAGFNQLRLGCPSNDGDVNTQSFSQIAFFVIVANVLYRIRSADKLPGPLFPIHPPF